jgi:hypothetical protein
MIGEPTYFTFGLVQNRWKKIIISSGPRKKYVNYRAQLANHWDARWREGARVSPWRAASNPNQAAAPTHAAGPCPSPNYSSTAAHLAAGADGGL